MISVVFSTRKDNQPHIEHIKKTSGLGNKIEVIQYVNDGAFGLTELYNKALKETTNNIVIFCHDDIVFDTKNWGTKLLRVMNKNPEFGIVGIAGSREVPVSGQWWENPSHMYGQVYHKHEGKRWLSKYSDKKIGFIDNTVIVDGLFFVVDKEKIQCDFDEKVEGFHFYEIDFCFRNYLEGVKIGVTSDIDVTHLSIGQTNEKWEENRKIFAEKYKDNLPAKIDKIYSGKEKFKILLTSLEYDNNILLLVKKLKKEGHNVSVCCNFPDKVVDSFSRINVKTYHLQQPPGYMVGDGKWLMNTPNGQVVSQKNKLYRVSGVDYEIIHNCDDKTSSTFHQLYSGMDSITKPFNGDFLDILDKYKKVIFDTPLTDEMIDDVKGVIKGMVSPPLVSIIIPCYNDAQFINDAIESSKNLTYPNKEIIIINDGSKDVETIDILKALEETDKSLTILHHEVNKGLPAARNTAISESKGVYILPHDVDDTFEPQFLSIAVTEAEKNNKISPVYCDTTHTGFIKGVEKRPEWSLGRLRSGPFIVSCSLFRREAWELVGGYDESMKGWEDYDLWWRIGNSGYEGVRIPHPLFNYRHIRPSMIQEIKNNEKELYNYIMNKPLPQHES